MKNALGWIMLYLILTVGGICFILGIYQVAATR